VLDLYKFGIEKDILVYNKKIDEAVFNNIVSVACMQKEYDWTNRFITDYYSLLPDKVKLVTFNIARASVAICVGKYKDVINLLNQLEVKEILQQLRVYTLYIRALYHLQEYALVTDKCKSFVKFVRRRKLPQDTVEATLNFTRLLEQFIKVNNSRQFLEQKTMTTSPLFCKDWFMTEAAKRY
jgi:hypothetical protein